MCDNVHDSENWRAGTSMSFVYLNFGKYSMQNIALFNTKHRSFGLKLYWCKTVELDGGSILARRTANFAYPTCQFWLVFAGSPFRIFKKVRIILRPKFTNLNFRLPTIYINRLTRKKLKPWLENQHMKLHIVKLTDLRCYYCHKIV